MLSETKSKRYDELVLVLQFDSQYEKVFTTFERIYIQYERAEILRRGDWEIPSELNTKVQEILLRIKQIKWQPYND